MTVTQSSWAMPNRRCVGSDTFHSREPRKLAVSAASDGAAFVTRNAPTITTSATTIPLADTASPRKSRSGPRRRPPVRATSGCGLVVVTIAILQVEYSVLSDAVVPAPRGETRTTASGGWCGFQRRSCLLYTSDAADE